MSENENPVPIKPQKSLDFIRKKILEDVKNGRNHGQVTTRFPPEPNGYLHIGHAKSICLNFGVAAEYGGVCHLRFDDTNPEKEDQEYIESIQEDVQWLGFDWDRHLYCSSDYFEKFYQYAIELIQRGKAYVCSLSPQETREYRGTLTRPGKDSPYRTRSVEENLDLFKRMRQGEFPDGTCALRAKINMAHPNIAMRDPALYRIRHAAHHRTDRQWCIYPMYDFAHCLSDSIEKITHSLCTLEFEDRRPLYDWILDALEVECHPQQVEFARLSLTYTILSKRKLLHLVNDKHVSGWDDPRMPTISGLRRRGVPPEAIRNFCEHIGVDKTNSIIDIGMLEYYVREYLNKKSPRVMVVLRPLKVVIDNYPNDQVEELEAENNPEDPRTGTRKVPFSRVIYIEQEDFQENPPPKYFRLVPGREVRLKHAYYITCQNIVKDETTGEIIELHCSYDPESRGGGTPDGRKVKSTLHWVSAAHALDIEVNMCDHLFSKPNPEKVEEGTDFKDNLNPHSLLRLKACKAEPGLEGASPGNRYQFLRHGYFCVDPDSMKDNLIFNRTVSLRDTWVKIKQKTK